MDIVERLRKVPSIGGYFKDELSQEAADEIERLREALRKIANIDYQINAHPSLHIARTALKEKE
jgi:hypothetical protein